MSEEPAILLARIEERQKAMYEMLEQHMKIMRDHAKDDDETFKSIRFHIFWLTIGMVVVAMATGGPELLALVLK